MTAPTWGELADALDHVQEAGGSVPCREGGLVATSKWISSHPAEQRAAAEECGRCAALAMCREYAEMNPAEAGALGGTTELDRKRPVGRPSKSERSAR